MEFRVVFLQKVQAKFDLFNVFFVWKVLFGASINIFLEVFVVEDGFVLSKQKVFFIDFSEW